MTQTLTPPLRTRNAAETLAELNYAANRAAFARTQPDVVDQLAAAATPEVQWLFARDGALTAMLPGERWWGGCSLPRRSGQFMFKNLDVAGAVACFLSPAHAAHLRIVLDALEPHQAVIALVPDEDALRIILNCQDFSDDIDRHRLWFAAGAAWQAELAELFVANPGLPTPTQFIRAISPDSAEADALIGPAQKIFADESNRRAGQIQSVTSGWRPARKPFDRALRLCLIAPSHFRLWNDAPTVLSNVLAAGDDVSVRRFDSDDPATASPLALARLAAECDAVVAANLFRADLAGVFPADMPLVTWVTLPRLAEPAEAGPRDALVVADPAWQAAAGARGWPAGKVHTGGWPPSAVVQSDGAQSISLIADTFPLAPPKQVSDFSSHTLLWDMIVAELREDPGAVGIDLEGYLKSRMARLKISEESFNTFFFIERLIVPAYQQGLARALVAQGVPLRLYGKGWDAVESLAPHVEGPVTCRTQFRQILADARALVHAWPISYAHPIDFAGVPVLRPFAPKRGAAEGGAPLTAQIIRDALV